jgi:hypothetical protein
MHSLPSNLTSWSAYCTRCPEVPRVFVEIGSGGGRSLLFVKKVRVLLRDMSQMCSLYKRIVSLKNVFWYIPQKFAYIKSDFFARLAAGKMIYLPRFLICLIPIPGQRKPVDKNSPAFPLQISSWLHTNATDEHTLLFRLNEVVVVI